MTEVPQIPWGAVLSNFLWILGASIILATFSYHEYLVHLQKIKRKEILRKVSFKRPSVLGMTLIAAGISLSLSIPWLSAISGSVAFLFTIWFFKLIIKIAHEKN